MILSDDSDQGDIAGKRILIVHLAGGMGDLLLSTVILKPLKDYYKDSSITMMIRSGLEEVVEENPYVTNILSVPGGDLSGGRFSRWVKVLKEEHFDIALVLWSRSSEAWMLFKAGIPVRVGQGSRLLYSFLYTHKVSVRSEKGDIETHWTEIMLDYVRALGVPVPEERQVELFVPKESFGTMKKLLESAGADPGAPCWGLHIGKGMTLNSELWPVDWFAALADALVRQLGGTVVFVGDDREEELVEDVLKLMEHPERAVNFTGKTTIYELAALTTLCRAFISPDSAPGHVSSVMNVPTVPVFALKSDFPERWKPFGKKVVSVINGRRSCTKSCVKEKCRKFVCYYDIEIDEVIGAVKKLVSV